MRPLKKIKLTALNRNEIADREQRMLTGGADYKCGCVSICLEDACVCFENGGNMLRDNNMNLITSEKNSDDISNTTADYNQDRDIMP